ncbi:hypothetical protein [Streptomyces sp. NPDC056264]|uniref:hypothetical protein n=1 Tax=Streptomyces sp. NPDC056264 TaxID=3345767 RepID=UPI003AAD5A3B
MLDGSGQPAIQPLLDTLDVHDAAREQANDLHTRINELPARPQEAETHLEHLAISGSAVTSLTERLPSVAAGAARPPGTTSASSLTRPARWARDVYAALDHPPLPRNIEGHPRPPTGLLKLGILTKADTGRFTRKQIPTDLPGAHP